MPRTGEVWFILTEMCVVESPGVLGLWAVKDVLVPVRDKVEAPVTLRDSKALP